MKKRFFAALLALAMICSVLPAMVMAEDVELMASAVTITSLNYKAYGSVSSSGCPVKQDNVMWVSFWNVGTWGRLPYDSDGVIEVIAPNGEKSYPSRIKDGGDNYFCWEMPSVETGKYTVNWYANPQRDADGSLAADQKPTNSLEKKMSAVELTVDPGDGKFETEVANPLYAFENDSLDMLGLPKVVSNDPNMGIKGWKDAEGKTVTRVPALGEDGSILKLTAVVGELARYDYDIVYADGDRKGESIFVRGDDGSLSASIDLGTAVMGYTAEDITPVNIEFKNTGNQKLTMYGSFNCAVGSLKLDKNPIEPGETVTGRIVAKTGLTAGEHTGVMQFYYNSFRIIRSINVKFTVNSKEITVKPAGITKEYGETRTSSNVEYEILTEDVDSEFIRNGLTFTSAGFEAAAKVGSYPYAVSGRVTGYSVKIDDSDNPAVTVTPSVPMVESESTTGIAVGQKLSESVITAKFVNRYTNEPVPGTFQWKDGDKKMSSEGTVTETYIFTPRDTQNYKTVEDEVPVTVSKGTPTVITAVPGQNLEPMYDAKPHAVSFQADRDGEITVRYRLHGSTDDWTETAPIDAGSYDVVAHMKSGGGFAEGTGVANLTIRRRELTQFLWNPTPVSQKAYNGRTNANIALTPVEVYYRYYRTVDGKSVADDVRIKRANVAAEFLHPNAGKQTIELTLHAENALEGAQAANYVIPHDVVHHAEATIVRLPLTFTVPNKEKFYGEYIIFDNEDFDIYKGHLVEGETKEDVKMVLTSAGAAVDAEVGEYEIKGDPAPTSNYVRDGFQGEAGKVIVKQTTPGLIRNNVAVTDGKEGKTLSTVSLNATFENPYTKNEVKGDLHWKQPDTVIKQGVNEYEWEFIPEDTHNYTTREGSVAVNGVAKEPASITVKLPENRVYDGNAKVVTAETNAEGASVTVQYQKTDTNPHDEGQEQPSFEGGGLALADVNGWTDNAPVNAGNYLVKIDVAESGDYAANSTTTVLDISPAEPKTGVAVIASGVETGQTLDMATLTGTFMGVDGETIEGKLGWMNYGDRQPEQVTVRPDVDYTWVFLPASENYRAVSGTARVNVTLTRAPKNTVVYNLPGETGNYGYVHVDGENLKVGDVVAFYNYTKDVNGNNTGAEPDNPECREVHITRDMQGQDVRISLDSDALSAEAGEIYVRIEGSTKWETVKYKNEVGFAVDPSAITVKPQKTADVKLIKSESDYEIISSKWIIGEDCASVEGSGESAVVAGLDSGSATLTVNAVFKHPDPNSAEETVTVTRTASVTVTDRAPTTVTVSLPEQTYDGKAKAVSVEANREGEITVEYAPDGTENWTDEPPVNAGTYRVKATIAPTSDYLGHTTEAKLVINPLEVVLDKGTLTAANKTYDGGNTASVSGKIAVTNKVEGDDVSVDGEKITAVFSDVNAGQNKTVNVAVPAYSLIGDDSGNYSMSKAATFAVTANIEPMPVVITPVGMTKFYGETKTSADVKFTNDKGVPNEELKITFGSEGFNSGAAVKDKAYPYTVEVVANSNYTVTTADDAAGVVVKKAVPVKVEAVADGIRTGVALSRSKISGHYKNPYTEAHVDGEFTWAEPDTAYDEKGNYQAAYVFTPADEANYEKVTGDTVSIIVSDKIPTNFNKLTDEDMKFVYDGQPKSVRFTADREGEIVVKYAPDGTEEWTSDAPVDAGVYAVRAYIEATDEFAPGLTYATVTIAPVAVIPDYSGLTVETRNYDGTVDALLTGTVAVGNLVEGDEVNIPASAVTAVYENSAAGVGKNVTVSVAADSLTGKDAANYTLAAGTHHTTGDINKRPVDIIASAEKEYGRTITLDNDSFEVSASTPLVVGETKADIYAELTSEGTALGAAVGSYDITAAARSNTNYEIREVTGQVTVSKATPTAVNVNAGNGLVGNALSTVDTLSGDFENPYSHETVEGTLKWEDPEKVLSEGTYSYGWIFTPKDTKNYNSPVTGYTSVTASDKVPAAINVTKPANLIYDGKAKAVTATTDADAPVSIEYRTHSVDVQADEVTVMAVVDGIADGWSDKAPVDAGTYDFRVSVAETQALAGNTVVGTIVIEQALPAGTVTAASVEEGSYLSESALTANFKTVDDGALNGTVTWDSVGVLPPEQVLVLSETGYSWIFTPEDPNYKTVYGTSEIVLIPNYREAAAVIYNIPAVDYAYVDVDGVNLQEGDTVTFYMDKEMTDPVSDTVTVPWGTNGQFKIILDDDALSAQAGTVYVKIGSSRIVTAVDYKAQVGVVLEPDEIIVTKGSRASINAKSVDDGYEILDRQWSVNDNAIAGVMTSASGYAEIRGYDAGSAVLTVSVTFAHPDPAVKENIIVTVTAPVTVTDKDKTTITITGRDKTYNGKAQPVSVRADRQGEITVVYRPVGGGDNAWTADAPVNAGSYEVKASIEETDTYAAAVATDIYTIAKADPKKGVVTASAIEKGDVLAASVLTHDFEGVDGGELEGAITWDTVLGAAPESVTVERNAEYGWTFVPADSVNYNTVTGKSKVLLTGIFDAVYSGGRVEFTLVTGGSASNVDLYVAEYKDGALIGVKSLKRQSVTGTERDFTVSYTRNDDSSVLKVFAWTDDVTPIADSVTVE